MIASNDKITRAHLVIINSAKGSIESDVEEFISLILSAGAAINGITHVELVLIEHIHWWLAQPTQLEISLIIDASATLGRIGHT